MSREISPASLAAANADVVRPALFFEGEFATGWVRLWSGAHEIEWDGKVWMGAGALLSVGPVAETTDQSAQGFTAALSGIPTDVIALALGEARQGKAGTAWLGFFDEAGALIVDPLEMFQGRLDVPSIEESAETATVTITYESGRIDMGRPRERRYTSEDQKRDYPDDLGFDFVEAITELELTWGHS